MGREEIRFEVFPTRSKWTGSIKHWNWRVRNLDNGKILGGSTGQNYSRKIDAWNTAMSIARYASIADVVEVDS